MASSQRKETTIEPITPLVDSHCHLDLPQFDPDRDAVVARARAAGIQLLVNPGIDLDHSRRAIALAEKYPEVYAAVGVHPNSSAGFDQAALDELRRLAGHPKVVAIGEIGLDTHWDTVPLAQQIPAFQAQLALAQELGLPVIIHNREATEQVVAVLEEWVTSPAFRRSPLARRPFAGVLHAFGGDEALAQQAYGWNFVLGLGGPVTFKNARRLHELTPKLRLDRLMLETDAPYLAPHPYRGKRNEPAYVALVCRRVAELAGRSPQDVAQITTAVARQFFGLENRPGVETATQPSFHANQ